MSEAQAIISAAQGYAKSAFNAALPLVQSATSTVGSITFGGFSGGLPDLDPPDKAPLNVSIPEFQLIPFAPAAAPAAPADFLPTPQLDVGEFPKSRAVNPGFTEPALPAQMRAFNVPPPSISTSFDFPEPPGQLQNPQLTAPVLDERAAPAKPAIALPVFDAARPDAPPTARADHAQQFESAYRGIAPTMRAALDAEVDAFTLKHNPRFHEQMALLESRLASMIEGGSALSPAVEDALYSRTARKVDAEYRRTRDAAMGDAARRGFSMPDGALFSALRQTRQDGANNATLAAAEIAIKQAELEQQNVQFAITASASLRTAVIGAALSYHGNLVQINGQALDFAKSVLSAMIETYNALVKAYEARLDGYKAEAGVYEVKMRGALALVEIYKAEIDGFKALNDADMGKVRIYQARIDALNSLATMYRSQVEAVVSKASMEKLKIEMFGAQVEAFRSETAAKSAEYQGYAAAISGQEGKLRAYSEEIRAHSQEVQAHTAKLQAQQVAAQTAISINEGITRRYLGAVEAYRAVTAGQASTVTATLESQRAQLLTAQAKFGAQEAQARYGLEYYKARADISIKAYTADISAMIEGARISTAQMKSVADIAMSGADIYKGLASAALSGVNTLVAQTLAE